MDIVTYRHILEGYVRATPADPYSTPPTRNLQPVRLAGGRCWFVLREEYCRLVAGGWFVVREKYCWLVADKPSEQAVGRKQKIALEQSPYSAP
jgi:hypothetical protein